MMAFSRICLVLLALALCVVAESEQRESDTQYITPTLSGPAVFLETFNDDHWTKKWTPSSDPKFRGDWEVQESEYVRVSGDRGLVVASVAKHHAIAALFDKLLDTTDKDLVVQYEVQWQHGMECGGAYMKILTATPDLDITQIHSDTPYTIMFGPDKCGNDDKVHFIIRHENPVNHTFEEKHLLPRPHVKVDKLTHLFTLWVRKDNTFEVSIDREVVKAGNLLEDLQPAINPPKEIDDVTDIKPEDWVDAEFIPDPEATKPADWDEDAPPKIDDPTDKKPEGWLDDEPEMIPDPSANKPDDWNDEEDGEWVALEIENPKCQEHGCGVWTPYQIKNPEYKGKWAAPQIKNPAWKGIWRPKQVPNPHYFEDLHPSNFPKMAGVAFELWTMTDGVLFDNILFTHDKKVADDFAEATWAVKHENELKKFETEQAANAPPSSDESYVQTAERYFNLVYEFAQENPVLLGLSVALGLIPVFVCIALSGPSKKPVAAPQEPAEEVETEPEPKPTASTKPSKSKKEEKEESEEEIQAEPSEEIKKSPPVRKRVPRADH